MNSAPLIPRVLRAAQQQVGHEADSGPMAREQARGEEKDGGKRIASPHSPPNTSLVLSLALPGGGLSDRACSQANSELVNFRIGNMLVEDEDMQLNARYIICLTSDGL